MKTIWKYEMERIHEQVVNLPAGAVPLSVQMQRGRYCLWALVDSDHGRETEACRVVMHGTGRALPEDPGQYLGTIQDFLHGLVVHVFLAPEDR